MLDASLNFDGLSTYFTSLYRYGNDDKAMYGTDCSDTAGWRDWFIPANDNTKFRVARDCMECKSGGIHGDNTGYYMTNGYFCPVMFDNDGCVNIDDTKTENVMCSICDDVDGLCGSGEGRDGAEITDSASYSAWCDCYTLQLSADHQTAETHNEYCQEDLNWRPNLLIDRSQCTCYKPDEAENTIYDVSEDELPLVSTTYQSDLESLDLYIDDSIQWDTSSDPFSVEACSEKETHLTQEDFLFGTYRILECGTYILDEDIIINFNKPAQEFSYENGDSPNAYAMDDLPWYPTTDQQESGQYFGLNAFWGPFSLGFFAGISIETSYVDIDLNGHSIGMAPEFYLQQRFFFAGISIETSYVDIDLNGHSIGMAPEFYLQQRFFAIIELGNKQFESRQGPVDFGRENIHIKFISIKNGVLGLTSHHGIHGAAAKEVTISGLNILNFDVGGIQCNGCKQMVIEDCDIGPQNMNIPVLGRYVHGRIVLSRLRYLVDEYADEELQYANRGESVTVKQVADKLIEQMDMVYYHITQGIEFDDDDPQWIAAKKTFLNPTGWLDGGSAYGILLNGEGTAVVNIGRRTTETFDITVKNVEIHDLRVKPMENFWAQITGGSGNAIAHGFFFETIDWNHGNVYDEDTGYYLGDAYTDILFAANTFLRDEFCPLGPLFFLDGLQEWVFTDETDVWNQGLGPAGLSFRCGSDIQSHSAKGAIGVRIDGVQNFELEDVHIHNLHNWGDLGSDACGEYEEIVFETGVDVDKDIQYGYSGDNVHGILTNYAAGSISNVRVENLHSWHGTSIGVFIAKGSTVAFDGYVSMNNIIAGKKLSQQESDALILPNAPPFVCSIFVGPNSDADTYPEKTPSVTVSDDFSVMVTRHMYGYDYCNEDMRVGEMTIPMSPESYGSDPNRYLVNAKSINVPILAKKNDNMVMETINGENYNSMIIIVMCMFVVVGILIIRKALCDGFEDRINLK
eukprot:CAMPEP_0201591958 /NCGR_PEP_ID=MMETSP0190_2-20130828/189984_1 /ASSEMBLY_ACC=CAM_ASM_000263 /TAXON_ID=37353 /ORGANISM="Rosalina sp." /LENGTH=966 /DNA_ID=CAMNT_0048050509 /DNA_START=186 /DNA_END=3086 /DNA_ORIENTATION=-